MFSQAWYGGQISSSTGIRRWYDLAVEEIVVYLGSCIAEDGNTLVAIKHRICCAETVVKRLNPRVFCRHSVDNKLKGHFNKSAVFASLLYGLEHCAFGTREQRCLDGFFLRMAKRVMYLRYDHHLSYEKAEEELGVQRPSLRLMEERLRGTGTCYAAQTVCSTRCSCLYRKAALAGVDDQGGDSQIQSKRT